MEKMQVKKLVPFATMPVRGSKHAAGFDLSSAYDVVVPARGRAVVKTGLAIAIPENTYARIAPRSGLAVKKFIDTGAGVVDYDYRGEVGVVLFNHAEENFQVSVGDRIAQLILEKISMVDCEEADELFDTERGSGGFGSTGVSGEPDEKKQKVDK
jgi:deoxyuridine 5'-triphosphate nucleotidohydrolase